MEVRTSSHDFQASVSVDDRHNVLFLPGSRGWLTSYITWYRERLYSAISTTVHIETKTD